MSEGEQSSTKYLFEFPFKSIHLFHPTFLMMFLGLYSKSKMLLFTMEHFQTEAPITMTECIRSRHSIQNLQQWFSHKNQVYCDIHKIWYLHSSSTQRVLKDSCAEAVPKQEADPVLMISKAKQARNGNSVHTQHTENELPGSSEVIQ